MLLLLVIVVVWLLVGLLVLGLCVSAAEGERAGWPRRLPFVVRLQRFAHRRGHAVAAKRERPAA